MGLDNEHNSDDGVMEQLQALGYIDPGRGSFFMQSLASPFFRMTAAVKAAWAKLKGFFFSIFGGGSGDR